MDKISVIEQIIGDNCDRGKNRYPPFGDFFAACVYEWELERFLKLS